MRGKYFFIILIIFSSNVSIYFAQKTINILDPHSNENVSYLQVEKFEDGTQMTNDKCDGVIYLKDGNTFYKRIFSGPINIKWFGAKGDGDINDLGTDDTEAIKIALRSLSKIYPVQKMSGGNVYGGFSLFFPHGIYLVNDTFILPEGINIFGESYTSTVIHTKQPRYIFTNIRGFAPNGIDVLMSTDLSIRNLTLKQGGIELQGASNTTIENLRIMNLFGNKTDTGILVKLPVNLRIRDVKIFSSTGVGVLYEDTAGSGPSTTTTFENLWISHCKTGIIVDGNIGGSHGILTSRLYNSILEYNDIGLIIKGVVQNFVIRDLHLEQNKIAVNVDGTINMIVENIWSDNGVLNIKNSSMNGSQNRSIYLKNVNLPQNVDKSFRGKIFNN